MNAEVILTVEEMQDHAKWLAVRNSGIGGSDAAVIVGLNKWKSPLTLWMEKTGQKEPDDLSDNQRVYWGIKNEGNIAEWFEETTGKKVIRKGLMRSKEYPWMLATVDRMVVGEDAGLEIKTAGVDQTKKWADDEVPDSYYLQCQWYMAVTGLSKWYIAVLIGGNEARYKVIERNEAQVEELIKAGKEFWDKVQNNVMPEIDTSKDCGSALNDIYSQSNGATVQLPDAALKIITDLDQIKGMIKDLDAEKTAKENLLKASLGDNEVGLIGDRKVSWKTQAGRVSIDTKKLKAEQPAVFAQYSKQGAPTRVMRIS